MACCDHVDRRRLRFICNLLPETVALIFVLGTLDGVSATARRCDVVRVCLFTIEPARPWDVVRCSYCWRRGVLALDAPFRQGNTSKASVKEHEWSHAKLIPRPAACSSRAEARSEFHKNGLESARLKSCPGYKSSLMGLLRAVYCPGHRPWLEPQAESSSQSPCASSSSAPTRCSFITRHCRRSKKR